MGSRADCSARAQETAGLYRCKTGNVSDSDQTSAGHLNSELASIDSSSKFSPDRLILSSSSAWESSGAGQGWSRSRRKSIRKSAQKVTPALLVTSSILVIRQVLVTKSQEGVLALFLKGHGHKRFETARMERHPRVLDLRWTIEDGEAPVMGLSLASLVDK